MKRHRFQKVLAMMLSLGILTTTVFPTTSLAAEVQGEVQEGEQEQTGGSGDASESTAEEDAVEDEKETSDDEGADGKKDSETEESQGETADINEDVAEEAEEQPEDAVEAPSKVLLLIADTVPGDTFGAIAVEQLSGMVRLTYESEDLSQKALEQFTTAGCMVEYDKSVEMIDDAATAVLEVDHSQVAVEQMETIEELLTEEVSVESEQVRHIQVAVIDTGCDLNAINGRIAEGTDLSITDANGHGTLMAEIVASQTTENVKILPIKAFDDEGNSTVGQVYSAIMSACELGVDVINLSMSGAGTSQMLTKAIDYATSQGLIVVVSAGNDASDVAGFMPGNIDNGITVSATDQNEVFAEYSNYGDKIDFAALGEIIKDQGTGDTSDDLYYSGTSIASAFVSGYASCVLDNNHNADVVATFDKYAKDLGETGKDSYYGKGFLSLENIQFDVNKVHEKTPSEDIEVDDSNVSDITNTDNEGGEKNLEVCANPDGNNLTWKAGYASIENLFGQNLNNEKEFLVDSTTNKIVIYSTGYTANGTYYAYNSSSTPANRKSKFDVLKFYLEAAGKHNVFLQTDITCTSTINISATKGLHGYGYYLRQRLNTNKFTLKDGVYLDSPIIKVNDTGILKIAHTELKGQAADGILCGVVNTSGNIIKSWSSEEAKTKNQNKTVNSAPQYLAVHDGISSEGTLYATNLKAYNCKRAILISNGTATVNGGCFYKNKGSGIAILNSSGAVNLNGVNCFANSSTSNELNGNAFGTGTYCNYVAPDETAYSGIAIHAPTTVQAWTVSKINKTFYPMASKNERFGISHSHGSTQESKLTDVRANNNCKDGIIISNTEVASRSKVTLTNCILNNNAENGIQNSKGNVLINGTSTSVSNNKNNGMWNDAGTLTVNNGDFYSNAGNGVDNASGTLTVNYGVFRNNGTSDKKMSGLNSDGTGAKLTVNGGRFYSNTSHGIAIGGGTANIYYAECGTYYNSSAKTWVNTVGNGNSGIRTKNATTNVYGGVYFYNKIGIECQSGTLNFKYDTTNKRTTYVSLNKYYGLYSKDEVITNGVVETAGGNITVDNNALVNSHSNVTSAIYVGKKAKATIGAGSYYNSPTGISVVSGGTATLSGGSVYNNSNGIHNSGTTTLSGGDVYNNTTYGVYNAGTFTMSGGKVRDNKDASGNKMWGVYNKGTTTISGGTISGNDSGLYNEAGTATITKGTIQSNETGISNALSGKTTINGTNKTDIQIKSNTYGVYNTADSNGVEINKATVTDNTTADLGQSGETFKMNGANTNTNVIELGVKDGVPEVVTIDGTLTEKKTVIIKADPDTMTKADIDKNMAVGRPMFKCINMTKAQKQAMIDPENGKLKLQSGQQTLMGNGTKRNAIMRCFKNNNMNESLVGGNVQNKEDYIVLSTKYAGIYKVNEVIDGVTFKIPDAADIFWNEDNHITMPELWATIGGVLKKFDIIGWLKDGMGDPVPVGSIMSFLFGESNKDHTIEAKMGLCNLLVDGNGQSEGENYVIEEFNCVTDTLPQNTFKKEFLDDYYYIELGEQKRYETKYSYQGWSLSDESTYLSEGVMQPQDKLDYADVLTYMDEHKDSITYGDNGLPNIPLYAVWDKYPELQAKDVGIVSGWVDESSGFAKTDAELQEIIFEKVLGTDDEDGTLTNGVEEKGVICTDFDKEEIRQFKHTGTATLTYRATDGVGNVTERKVRLYINSSDPIEPYDLDHPEKGGAYPNRARCINRKYYDAGKVSVGLEPTDAHYLDGYRAGGLIPTDRWYTDPEYAAVIEEAFDNLENDTPEFVWEFTHEQVLETQAYIDEHGFGDSEEEGALRRYFDKYKGNITRNNIKVK